MPFTQVTDLSIRKGEKVKLVDRLQDAELRVWADLGHLIEVLLYDASGRTDGLPVYMQKQAIKPIDEPGGRWEGWGDPRQQYYRDDKVRLVADFDTWIMMVEKEVTHFPAYVLVRFGEETSIGFCGRSMAWFVHVAHLCHIKPKISLRPIVAL